MTDETIITGAATETDAPETSADATPTTASQEAAGEPAAEGSATHDRLIIEEEVVERITAIELEKIDGIIDMKGGIISTIQRGLGGTSRTRGVSAYINSEGKTTLDIAIVMEYGKSAPEIFAATRDAVAEAVERMTGLVVSKIDLRVADIMTREEFEATTRKVQDAAMDAKNEEALDAEFF